MNADEFNSLAESTAQEALRDIGDEPAFPMVGPSLDDTRYCYGLTKREYFAALAMQGIIASPDSDCTPEEAAKTAVMDADALLAELENKP